MKIKLDNNREIETSEDFDTGKFGIRNEDMAIILEILRNKMYSDPIGAICREISCNSRDANIEAGRRSIPIEIAITAGGMFEKEFQIEFKDTGVGISKERMNDVFLNYGASTKRNTNKQVGGFGLGAKTPFAYNDSFGIRTIVDKVEYTYLAAIENMSTGSVYLLAEKECSERNGTTIIVPIKNKNDLEEFQEKVNYFTSLWDVPPKLTGFQEDDSWKKISVVVKEEKYILHSNYNNLLVIEGVPYYERGLGIIGEFLLRNHIGLKFKTGEIEVTANREDIHYDENVKKIVAERCKQVLAEEMKKIDDIIQAEKNEVAGIFAILAHKNELWNHLIRERIRKITKNGYYYFCEIAFRKEYGYRKESLRKSENRCDIEKVFSKKHPVIIIDEPVSVRRKDQYIIEKYGKFIGMDFNTLNNILSTDPSPVFFRMNRSTPEMRFGLLRLRKMFLDAGGEILLYSEIEVPKEEKKRTKPIIIAAKAECYYRTGDETRHIYKKGEFKNKIAFITVPKIKDIVQDHYRKASLMQTFGIKAIIVSQKEKEIIEKDVGEIVEVNDYITKINFQNELAILSAINNSRYTFRDTIIRVLEQPCFIKENPFPKNEWKWINSYLNITSERHDIAKKRVENVLSHLDGITKAEWFYKMTYTIDAVIEKYPLLFFVRREYSTRWITEGNIAEHLHAYIKSRKGEHIGKRKEENTEEQTEVA